MCFMERSRRKKERLRILIPNFLFRLRKQEEKMEKRAEMEEENYHTARLFQACENIIPLCFECSMCFAYYALLISKTEAKQQQPESECFSENASSSRAKMEAKKYFCSTEKCYLFLGENENVSQSIRRFVSLLGYDSPFIPFHSGAFLEIPFCDRVERGKGLKRFHDNHPR